MLNQALHKNGHDVCNGNIDVARSRLGAGCVPKRVQHRIPHHSMAQYWSSVHSQQCHPHSWRSVSLARVWSSRQDAREQPQSLLDSFHINVTMNRLGPAVIRQVQPTTSSVSRDGDVKFGLIRSVPSVVRSPSLKVAWSDSLAQHVAIRRRYSWCALNPKIPVLCQGDRELQGIW